MSCSLYLEFEYFILIVFFAAKRRKDLV
jgi:hypothetical protein